jgi:hypothetical protein
LQSNPFLRKEKLHRYAGFQSKPFYNKDVAGCDYDFKYPGLPEIKDT